MMMCAVCVDIVGIERRKKKEKRKRKEKVKKNEFLCVSYVCD